MARSNVESLWQSVIDFLKNNWLFILGAILVLPYLVSYLRKMEAKDKSAEVEAQQTEFKAINMNPATQDAYINQNITTSAAIKDAAQAVYHHLGVKYSWYDPRHWSENDEAAFLAIAGVSSSMKVPQKLIEVYYFISCDDVNDGRDLRSDCQALLDSEYYNKLIW